MESAKPETKYLEHAFMQVKMLSLGIGKQFDGRHMVSLIGYSAHTWH